MGTPGDEATASTMADTTSATPRTAADRQVGLSAGDLVGRYRLVGTLGAGAMGVVWRAIDPQLERTVAIKVVHPALALGVDAPARLLREARAMAKLSNRAVVTVHDAGEADGRLFLAMELVDGTTLGAMLAARTPASIADWRHWLAILIEAGRGLEAAHRAGILHRDFKPDNVLVEREGRVCVADFGVASLADTSLTKTTQRFAIPSHALELTQTGTLLGTPMYMSPQQLRGETVDALADQFSFCVAVYEALYGTRPYPIDTRGGLAALAALVTAIDAGPVAPPAESAVPHALRDVVLRGLAVEPGARWPDMTALLRALTPFVAKDAPPPAPRRRWIAVAAALAAVAVAATTIALIATRRAPHDAGPAAPRALFKVPFITRLALSPDGKRVAIAADRLEIRELDGPGYWSQALAAPDVINEVELDADTLRFGLAMQTAIGTWAYTRGAPPTIVPQHGLWQGELVGGTLFGVDGTHLDLVRDGKVAASWPIARPLQVATVSPDRKRFAYLDESRFTGRIVVIDPARPAGHDVFRSDVLTEPTALAWLDADTLVYATGSLEQPKLERVHVGADSFGAPAQLYTTASGWFTRIAARAGRLVFVEAHPSTLVRRLDRGDSVVAVELDPAQDAVSLGWTATGALVTWNRVTQRIQHGAAAATSATGGAAITREAANATIAGDLLILALRRPGGRELLAISLRDGSLRWRSTDDGLFAVRCAGDTHAPCLAIQHADDGGDRVVTFDPETAAIGSTAIATGTFEDLAVSDDGARFLLVDRTRAVGEFDRAGALIQRYHTGLETPRSTAYDPLGGIDICGTVGPGIFQAARIEAGDDGKHTILFQSNTDILSLVRPSHDGKHLVVVARTFSPELFELPLK